LSLYRPFYKQYFYFDRHFNGRTYQWFDIFQDEDNENKYIAIPGLSSPKDFHILASQIIIDLNCLPAGSQCLPLYRYDKEGNRIDNITDWGLKQIQTHYQDETITKIDIFHYTYAVLHNPAYRTKYELNLKRDFPRLPYYENFRKWVNWGKQLMEIHINYETVTPYNLTRVDIPLKDNQKTPKPKLKADKTKDSIILDDVTTLSNIPKIAWEYM
ncbi:MAG: type ISP restriction/modification enzyme, partial [Dolichospermum sp.]